MKHEIDPKDTIRAQAFELWMKSPMPMVTLTKTFDVTRLCRVSHRRGIKFNSPMPMVTLTKTFDVTRLCRVSHRRGIKFNMLLVHRQDCQPDRRVLFAAGARETDEV